MARRLSLCHAVSHHSPLGRLEQAPVAEREEPFVTKYDVIEQANPEHVTGFF
jgi:hypothetical protein